MLEISWKPSLLFFPTLRLKFTFAFGNRIILGTLVIMYRAILKPSFDYLVILVTLPLWLLVLLFLGIVLFVFYEGKVFFVQNRPGLRESEFRIYKFRTLDVNGDPSSGFHSFLRRSGLDEVPQVINILKREMSLVGPRPLLVEYLDKYNPEQRRRHDVLPGITGLAQINADKISSWDDLFGFDLLYIRRQGFLLDLEILISTIIIKTKALFQREKGPSALPAWV